MQGDQPKYDVVIERDIKVRTRDGVNLYTDIYLPAKDGKPVDGKFPSIMVRTSYNKEDAGWNIDPYFAASRGYAVVLQDVRGRYKSEGSWYHGITESEDGYDAVEWIASQPWSNGKVGMTGISYLAAVQCAAAIAGAPHLTSIFHTKAPADYYQNSYRRGGAFLMYHVCLSLMFAASGKEARNDPVLLAALEEEFKHAPDWLARWPPKKGQTILSKTPWVENWLFDAMNHADYDDYWKKRPLWQVVENFEKFPSMNAHFLGGWYDKYNESPLYTGLSDKKMKTLRLLMGPWTHLDTNSYAGDVEFGKEASMTFEQYQDLQLRWFGETMNGEDNGVAAEPPVRIFVMGGGDGRKTREGRLNHGGRWRAENEWPLGRAAITPYYLLPGGGLGTGKSSEVSSSTTYEYDPMHPVPTIGNTSYFFRMVDLPEGLPRPPDKGTPRSRMKLFVPYGPYDERERPGFFGCTSTLPLSMRQDVLAFQTPPLAQDVEVTGIAAVKLYVSTSAPDTDFTAKLIDVHPENEDYPSGYAMLITDSILRARYRDGFERSAGPMKPGEVYELTIRLPPTSNMFAKGHRIRVDVSSSNFPQFDPNPNTGELYMKGGISAKALNTVHHSGSYPSHALLPVIPTA